MPWSLPLLEAQPERLMTLPFARKFKRVATLHRQFGFMRGLRILLAYFFRQILDSDNTPSYSQTGEDRILATMLQVLGLYDRPGFYVDVGSNEPRHFSNTYSLYTMGWRGLCIDANDELIRKHQRIRKNDIAVCAAVSDREQEITFTHMKNPLVSSLDPAHVKTWSGWVGVRRTQVMKTQPLQTLLERYDVLRDFDVLSIDVEGHDFEVLTSFDLNVYRPKLIVVEIHGYDLDAPQPNKLIEYLKAHRYVLIGYVVMNGYFMDSSLQNKS
jgi:FkbM family methyltransferase